MDGCEKDHGEETEMKSIIQTERECYICKTPYCEDHHIFGAANRKNSETYGLKVWLCPEHHRGKYSPHFDQVLDGELKQMAQEKFLETHTFDEWLEIS